MDYTDKFIGNESCDDISENVFFFYENNSPTHQHFKVNYLILLNWPLKEWRNLFFYMFYVFSTSVEIGNATLDDLFDAMMNQKSAYTNSETSNTDHIHKNQAVNTENQYVFKFINKYIYGKISFACHQFHWLVKLKLTLYT